jgi:hypothetical protein
MGSLSPRPMVTTIYKDFMLLRLHVFYKIKEEALRPKKVIAFYRYGG